MQQHVNGGMVCQAKGLPSIRGYWGMLKGLQEVRETSDLWFRKLRWAPCQMELRNLGIQTPWEVLVLVQVWANEGLNWHRPLSTGDKDRFRECMGHAGWHPSSWLVWFAGRGWIITFKFDQWKLCSLLPSLEPNRKPWFWPWSLMHTPSLSITPFISEPLVKGLKQWGPGLHFPTVLPEGQCLERRMNSTSYRRFWQSSVTIISCSYCW